MPEEDWLVEAREQLARAESDLRALRRVMDEADRPLERSTVERLERLRRIIAAAEDPTHDEDRSVEFAGVKVTIAKRSAEFAYLSHSDPDTVLVFIDTSEDAEISPIPLSVQINDSDLWEGRVPGTTNLDGIREER